MHLNGLEPGDLVIECVKGMGNREGEPNHTETLLFYFTDLTDQGDAVYRCDVIDIGNVCSTSGLQQFRIRYYPCHHLLSHPFECGMMRWL